MSHRIENPNEVGADQLDRHLTAALNRQHNCIIKIEGYASATSVMQGKSLDFYVSASVASFVSVTVWRITALDVLVGTDSAFVDQQQTTDDSFKDGCGWVSNFKLAIPESWPSGVYRAEFSHPAVPDVPAKICFVVRPFKRYDHLGFFNWQ